MIYNQQVQTSRKPRADAGQKRISQMEVAQLAWIGEQHAVRIDTLRKLLSRDSGKVEAGQLMTERSVRRRIQRWRTEGLIKYQVLIHRQPGWVWLTGEGLRRVGLAYRDNQPGYSELKHVYVCSEVRLRLEAEYGAILAWTGEREIRRRVNQLNPSARRTLHIPDGEARVDEESWAIETELTQKASQRIRTIVDKLSKQYDRVLYVTHPSAEQAIKREIERRPPQIANRFQILPLYTVVSDYK